METRSFSSGGVSIATELYKPPGTATGGAVILAYGSDGFVDNHNGPWATMIREYATELSNKGFYALVPDYFLRTGTPPSSIDYQQDGALQVLLHKNDWQSTIADAIKYATTVAGVDSSRVGLLGYSLGGYLTMRLRAQAKALVAFFPPSLDGLGPGATPGLPVEIHYGDRDFLDFATNAGKINLELLAEGAAVKLHCYPGANHGFTGNDTANMTARTLSKGSYN